jgi:hypothetical protein
MSERAIWAWTPRGGYGYTQAIPSVVLHRTAKRVRIRVMRQSGELVERSVTPDHVRPANDQYVEQHQEQHQSIYEALTRDQEARALAHMAKKADRAQLTPAQHRTLAEWIRRVGADDFYLPHHVFPARDNVDNAYRRTCTTLIARGALVAHDETLPVWERMYRPA